MRRGVVPALAALLAGAMYWLSSEFRPSGLLGGLQDGLQFLNLLPYLAGAVFGGSVHSPSSLVFALVLFLQFYLVLVLLSLAWRRFAPKSR